MTLVELLVACVVLVIVMAGPLERLRLRAPRRHAHGRPPRRASRTSAPPSTASSTRPAARRAAQLVSGGAGVALTLPGQCPHAAGDVAWCVTGGALQRIAGATDCTGTAQTLVTDVTSATPFSCLTARRRLPRLQVALTVNATASAAGRDLRRRHDHAAQRRSDLRRRRRRAPDRAGSSPGCATTRSGVALVLALSMMSVLALTTTALLLIGVVNQRGSYTSAQAKQAFAARPGGARLRRGHGLQRARSTRTAPPTGVQTSRPSPAAAPARTTTSVAERRRHLDDGRHRHRRRRSRRPCSAQALRPVDSSSTQLPASGTTSTPTTPRARDEHVRDDVQGGVTRERAALRPRQPLHHRRRALHRGSSLTVDGNLTVNGGAEHRHGTSRSTASQIGGTPSSSACTNANHGVVHAGDGLLRRQPRARSTRRPSARRPREPGHAGRRLPAGLRHPGGAHEDRLPGRPPRQRRRR